MFPFGIYNAEMLPANNVQVYLALYFFMHMQHVIKDQEFYRYDARSTVVELGTSMWVVASSNPDQIEVVSSIVRS